MLPLIAVLLLAPIAGILIGFTLHESRMHGIAILVSTITLAIVLFMAFLFWSNSSSQIGNIVVPYLQNASINIGFTVTQTSMIILVAVALVFFGASIAQSSMISEKERIYGISFLVAQLGTFGVLLSANLITFYIFWELSEVAAFFIIFVFGSFDRRHAATKFLVYSFASTLLFLFAALLIFEYAGTIEIAAIAQSISSANVSIQLAIATLLILSFGIKMPVFPLHGWLPEAYSEAPPTGSMILGGALSKIGAYGLLVTVLIIPALSSYMQYVAILFAFSAVYAALITIRQTELRSTIAYASMAGMGVIGFAITANNQTAVYGALYSIIAHSIGISVLFLCSGAIMKAYGTDIIEKLHGLVESSSNISYVFLAAALIQVGMPLTPGLIADILMLTGIFSKFSYAGFIVIIPIFLIFAYLFRILEISFFSKENEMRQFYVVDNNVLLACILLICAAVAFGLFPSLLIR